MEYFKFLLELYVFIFPYFVKRPTSATFKGCLLVNNRN